MCIAVTLLDSIDLLFGVSYKLLAAYIMSNYWHIRNIRGDICKRIVSVKFQWFAAHFTWRFFCPYAEVNTSDITTV